MDRSRIRPAVPPLPAAFAAILLLVLSACSGQPGVTGSEPGGEPVAASGPRPVPPPELCARAPHDRLCSFLPQDVTPNLLPGYDGLTEADQRPFDNFSWQMFLALNWPADAAGNPLQRPIGSMPAAPRVWMSYPRPVDVFGIDLPQGLQVSPDACAGVAPGQELPVFQLMAKSDHVEHDAAILEATGQPLIDRNLNFTLYDVRLNPVEAEYIQSKGLDTLGGQVAFRDSGQQVSFPKGFYADATRRTGGKVGAIEIKSAWRILEPAKGDPVERFFTTPALVYVAAEDSQTGRGFCFQATLGLVGFHAIQRTTGPGGQPQDWMWATFQHVDNQPEARNAADPTSLQPGPADCIPPPVSNYFSYFDEKCSGPACKPNTPPDPGPSGRFLWAPDPPYARAYAIDGRFGTQVVRCWQIYSETRELNAAFRAALPAPWSNYELINTQWQAHKDSPAVIGQVPRYLGNPVQETYIQSTASCLDCHGSAKTAAGQDANFSFLLGIPRLFAAAEGSAQAGAER